jgi:hypothetical protein
MNTRSMLHGENVPSSVSRFQIKIRELRAAPEQFKFPAIIDFAEPVYGRESWAVSITNLRALAKISGLDPDKGDFQTLANSVRGKSFDLHVSMQKNSKTRMMVRSLFFILPGERPPWT